mgnify:CR=1 FL=1
MLVMGMVSGKRITGEKIPEFNKGADLTYSSRFVIQFT